MILVLAQCGMQLCIYACWKLNQNYLAINVCEQRNVQGSCCKARCQLKKQMKNTENETNNKSQSNPKKIKFAETETCFLIPIHLSLPSVSKYYPIKLFKDYLTFYQNEFKNISIVPPEFVV